MTCAGMRPVNFAENLARSPLCFSSSTLLIPAKYLEEYNSRSKLLGSRRAYFEFIVKKFLPHLGIFKKKLLSRKIHKWKTYYQANEQKLSIRNFSPNPEDWEALRIVAGAFGVSMCYLFVFLLELEIGGAIKISDKIPEEAWNSVQNKECLVRKIPLSFKNCLFIDLMATRKTRKLQIE